MKRIFMMLFLILGLFIMVSCVSDSNQETIIITDMAGTKVKVPKDIKKVAAVSPSTANLMIAFGLGDKIDGVYKTVNDNPWATFLYPNSKDYYSYNYSESAESYFSRDVDLILLPDPTTVDSLRKSGLIVLNIRQFSPDGFDDYLFSFSEILKQIFPEVEDKVNEWQRRMNNSISDIQSKLETNIDKPKLYYIFGDKLNSNGSYLAYTDMPNSFIASLLKILNVTFVSESFTSNRPSEEEVLSTNPDVIVIGGVYQKFLYNELVNNSTWNNLDAVKNEKVYNIPVGYSPFEQNSIESPLFLYDLANKIYPEIFNYDLVDLTIETYNYWFDIEISTEEANNLLNGLGPNGELLINEK